MDVEGGAASVAGCRWMLLLLQCVIALGCSDGTGAERPDAGGQDSDASSGDCNCDDGMYCNGIEVCDPGDPRADADGCVRLYVE